MSYELLPFTMAGINKTYTDGKAMPWGFKANGDVLGELSCLSLVSTTGATIQIEMQKTFILPLNYLNQVLDTSNLFYQTAISQEPILLYIKFRAGTIAAYFGNETLFDATKTGIFDMCIVTVTKDSNTIKSDL